MKYFLMLLLATLSIHTFALGSSKPKWYNGPSERKGDVHAWIENNKNCANLPDFNKDKIKMKLTMKPGTKQFSGGWAYQSAQDGRWVHGETYLHSRTNFTMLVATNPNGHYSNQTHGTLGHEMGHLMLYNKLAIANHDRRYRHCWVGWSDRLKQAHDSESIFERIYDKDGEIIFDTSL